MMASSSMHQKIDASKILNLQIFAFWRVRRAVFNTARGDSNSGKAEKEEVSLAVNSYQMQKNTE